MAYKTKSKKTNADYFWMKLGRYPNRYEDSMSKKDIDKYAEEKAMAVSHSNISMHKSD